MGSQQFCLRWSNHNSNMLAMFEGLLCNEALVDVTLACEDDSLKAHKMVLSACSPFFQSLFIDNPCKHPIVILKDVKYSELKSIIDFMYRGEVHVSQEHLSSLLKTARFLKVKGLVEVTSSNRYMNFQKQKMSGHQEKQLQEVDSMTESLEPVPSQSLRILNSYSTFQAHPQSGKIAVQKVKKKRGRRRKTDPSFSVSTSNFRDSTGKPQSDVYAKHPREDSTEINSTVPRITRPRRNAKKTSLDSQNFTDTSITDSSENEEQTAADWNNRSQIYSERAHTQDYERRGITGGAIIKNPVDTILALPSTSTDRNDLSAVQFSDHLPEEMGSNTFLTSSVNTSEINMGVEDPSELQDIKPPPKLLAFEEPPLLSNPEMNLQVRKESTNKSLCTSEEQMDLPVFSVQDPSSLCMTSPKVVKKKKRRPECPNCGKSFYDKSTLNRHIIRKCPI
ncbi:uncharacterized protein LOC143239677 [Tachypleus tridentatus]|uniref:uncharacterized protein LOC143239677 n=1 Tax=Tachypleus tridentatus TaxID=6853 RepID=UPI003FD09535